MAETFSQHQIDVFKDCFNLYDKDRDGKVGKEELTRIMRALGHCVTHLETQEIMKVHGKETITFPECLKILAKQKPKNVEKEVLDAFILADKQKNGFISRSELEHLLSRGGEQMSREEVQQFLEQYGYDRMITQINYRELGKRISEKCPHPM